MKTRQSPECCNVAGNMKWVERVYNLSITLIKMQILKNFRGRRKTFKFL